MDIKKALKNYIKNKAKGNTVAVGILKGALHRSGHDEFEIIFAEDGKFVLIDTSKDVSQGIILNGSEIVDFKNTEDFETVTVNAYARYNVLKRISSEEDLRDAKEVFKKKRTWVIHYVKDDSGFNAHTHGLDSYEHPDFRIKKDIGVEEIAYLFNSLCKSIQRGNAFRDGDVIENLYDNCNILLTKSDDGFFEVSLIAREMHNSQAL